VKVLTVAWWRGHKEMFLVEFLVKLTRALVSVRLCPGNRSRSFDATYTRATGTGPRKGIGSSWFSRRHLPISVKLPISLKSPSVPSSPGPNQLTLKAPILTVTNETCKSIHTLVTYAYRKSMHDQNHHGFC